MQEKYLIVGSGPVGLTLSCLLAKYKLPFKIIDKKPSISIHSKALVIHAKTLELLDKELNMADRFINSGNKFLRANIYADEKKLGELDLGHIQSKFPFSLGISQSDTERILQEILNELGHKVEWNSELVDIENGESEVKATIKTSDGSADIESFKYVFACDGAHSSCRKKLGIDFDGKSYEQEFFLADLVLKNELDQSGLYAYLTKNNLLFMAPFKEGGHWRLITTVDADYQGDRDNPSLDDVYNLIDSIRAIKIKARETKWLSYFHVHCRIVDRYDFGRVFLLGDAAHIHSPVGGKGMNAGMHDAFNIVKNLKLNTLAKYSQERRPEGFNILQTTDRATQFILARGLISHNLQKFLLPFALSNKSIQAKVLNNIAMLG